MGVTEGSPSVRSEPETQLGVPRLPTSLQRDQGKCLLEEATESPRYKRRRRQGHRLKIKDKDILALVPPRTASE